MITKYPNDNVSDFYKCTEEIATVLDTYFGREHGPVSDMSEINRLVEEYVHGWGITARCYGADEVSRETQQEKEAETEEPWSKAINSMYNLDLDGNPINENVVSVTLPDVAERTGDIEDVTGYTVKNLKIKSNGLGGLEPSRRIMTHEGYIHEGDKFQLKYDSPYFGNGKVYMSSILDSVNLEEVLVFMNEAMKVTGDYHHCFVENLTYGETVNDIHILNIQTGS